MKGGRTATCHVCGRENVAIYSYRVLLSVTPTARWVTQLHYGHHTRANGASCSATVVSRQRIR